MAAIALWTQDCVSKGCIEMIEAWVDREDGMFRSQDQHAGKGGHHQYQQL